MDKINIENIIREIYLKMIQINQINNQKENTDIEFTEEEINFIKNLE